MVFAILDSLLLPYSLKVWMTAQSFTTATLGNHIALDTILNCHFFFTLIPALIFYLSSSFLSWWYSEWHCAGWNKHWNLKCCVVQVFISKTALQLLSVRLLYWISLSQHNAVLQHIHIQLVSPFVCVRVCMYVSFTLHLSVNSHFMQLSPPQGYPYFHLYIQHSIQIIWHQHKPYIDGRCFSDAF